MDHQHDSVNPTDFDVVRSTQFEEDFARGVCVRHILAFTLDNSCALGICSSEWLVDIMLC